MHTPLHLNTTPSRLRPLRHLLTPPPIHPRTRLRPPNPIPIRARHLLRRLRLLDRRARLVAVVSVFCDPGAVAVVERELERLDAGAAGAAVHDAGAAGAQGGVLGNVAAGADDGFSGVAVAVGGEGGGGEGEGEEGVEVELHGVR